MLVGQGWPYKLPLFLGVPLDLKDSSQLSDHPNSSNIMQVHIGDLFFFLIETQLLG